MLDSPSPRLAPPARSTSPATDAQYELSSADFDKVRALIRQRAGIALQPGKQAMVYSRLVRRLRETGHASFGSYLSALQSASGPEAEQEWQAFVNALTTNLTSFFREEHHFEELARELPRRTGRPLRVWCAAASTGEEPYSIAMTCVEAGAGDARIVASDIDTEVLARARAGTYPAQTRGLSPERLRRHFLRGHGANAGLIRVRPELQRMLEFRPFNLMSSSWQLGEPFDIVFCRNVMIYFDAPTQMQVLRRIHSVMKPGGLLFVGHSENFSDARDIFRLRGKTVYDRA